MAADSADGSINGGPRAVFAVNRRERDIDVCGRTLEIIGGVREVDRSVADADLVNVPAPVVRSLLFVCRKSRLFFGFFGVLFDLSLLFLNDVRQQLN